MYKMCLILAGEPKQIFDIMETLTELTHLNVVERSDGTFDIVKGTFEKVLGKLTFSSDYCAFEPQEVLVYSDLEAVTKIVFAVNIRLNDYITRKP